MAPGQLSDSNGKVKRENKGSWIWPLIGLIFVVAIAAAGVYVFLKMMEKPHGQPLSENVTVEKQVVYITPDTSAPIITNIRVKNINFNTVEISWITDEPATGHVMWRTKASSYNSSPKKEALLTAHSVELANLTPKTTYYYKVVSFDQFNNESESAEKTFDIGRQPGVIKIDVIMHSLGTLDDPGQPPRSYIKGTIQNTGDIALKPLDIEVVVLIEIAGRQGQTSVIASIDNPQELIKPGETRSFSVTVPTNTKPVYTITPRVINQ
jgi:hypothetical protein